MPFRGYENRCSEKQKLLGRIEISLAKGDFESLGGFGFILQFLAFRFSCSCRCVPYRPVASPSGVGKEELFKVGNRGLFCHAKTCVSVLLGLEMPWDLPYCLQEKISEM